MSRPNTLSYRNTLILSHIMANNGVQNNMHSTTELKDYLIADEIQRISSLSKEELVQELIDIKSKAIEQMSDYELLNQNKHEQI